MKSHASKILYSVYYTAGPWLLLCDQRDATHYIKYDSILQTTQEKDEASLFYIKVFERGFSIAYQDSTKQMCYITDTLKVNNKYSAHFILWRKRRKSAIGYWKSYFCSVKVSKQEKYLGLDTKGNLSFVRYGKDATQIKLEKVLG